MKTQNYFYSVASIMVVAAWLLVQSTTFSAVSARVGSTVHSHGYNANSSVSRAHSASVIYPANETHLGAVSAATDRSDQDCAQSPTVTGLLFYDGFDSGMLGGDWTKYATNDGRVVVSDTYPYSGTHSLLLDDSASGSTYSTAAAILTIDLSGQSEVELDFWWREFGDEDDPEDGVFISDDSGTTWHQVKSFNGDYDEAWQHAMVDIDAEAAVSELALNDHFQIKFQFYDNGPIDTDGYAIDEVRVRSYPPPTAASFPFYDGFESGMLSTHWVADVTKEGRVRISSSYPYSGAYGLLLDDYGSDEYSHAAAILTIDLSGQSQVELDFFWREFDDEDNPEDGVFISDDGAVWYQVLSFNGDHGDTWHQAAIDIDAEAAESGLALNDHFQIKFQFYDNASIDTDGYAIDEVRVRPIGVTSFPYYEGFESGALSSDWAIYNTSEGRIRVSSSYPYSGTHSLLLDDFGGSSYSHAAVILNIDLAGQSQVTLDFYWREFGDEDDPEDGVFISDDDGATWYQVLSFNGDNDTWQQALVDLDAQAAANGVTLSNHFQIKFQFYDNGPIDTDGYAIDEVRVRSNVAPALSWSGDTNYEQDGLHPEIGDVGDDYVYRITYADADRDPPGYVRVHIARGGTAIVGTPFTMTCVTGDYTIGVPCSYTKTGLEAGTDYSYYFTAQDDQGNPAAPTTVVDAPDVTITYRLYLPMVLRSVGPPAGPPVLDPIDNPQGNYSYTVSWSAVDGATSYILEEDDSAGFSSPTAVYDGSNTSTYLRYRDLGTYYYRVKAANDFGVTGWSNIESTEVTVEPPPGPEIGHWTGTTTEGNQMYFDVTDRQWAEFAVQTDWRGCGTSGTLTKRVSGPGDIINNSFSYSESRYSFDGHFNSTTSASGHYAFENYIIRVWMGSYYCTVFHMDYGLWTASYSP